MNSEEPKHLRDLTKPISSTALSNQRPPSGQGMLVETGGVLHQYFHDARLDRAERFARIFDSEVGWIEGFTKHAPSVGSHYEYVLRGILQEYLPGSLSVGTGFVYDSLRGVCSPQMDIIVYSGNDRSPIHCRGEFVIVDVKAVRAVSEVKKELKLGDVASLIRKTISQNLGTSRNFPHGIQRVSVFAHHSKSSTKAIAHRIAHEIDAFLDDFQEITHAGDPALVACFNMSVPEVFLRDRDEYITANIQRATDTTGKIAIHICGGGGIAGISPFLASMNPALQDDPADRDFVAPFLVNLIAEVPTKHRFFPVRRLSSMELMEGFADWEEFLPRTGRDGERIFGALVSSFTDLRAYTTLRELSKTHGFSWEIWRGKTPPGALAERGAPPNGGPAGPFGDSGVSGGPPSVS